MQNDKTPKPEVSTSYLIDRTQRTNMSPPELTGNHSTAEVLAMLDRINATTKPKATPASPIVNQAPAYTPPAATARHTTPELPKMSDTNWLGSELKTTPAEDRKYMDAISTVVQDMDVDQVLPTIAGADIADDDKLLMLLAECNRRGVSAVDVADAHTLSIDTAERALSDALSGLIAKHNR